MRNVLGCHTRVSTGLGELSTTCDFGVYNSIVIQSKIGTLKSINDLFITADSLTENQRLIQSLRS